MAKSGEVIKAVTGMRFPNSLMIQKGAEGTETLIVTEMVTKCLKAYVIKGAGVLDDHRVWAVMPGKFTHSP